MKCSAGEVLCDSVFASVERYGGWGEQTKWRAWNKHLKTCKQCQEDGKVRWFEKPFEFSLSDGAKELYLSQQERN